MPLVNNLSRRSRLAIATVVDIALHSRSQPVAAKALADRHHLPPRHFETLLQTLVKATILKGIRGPRGGYELARERRKISAGEIVRAILAETPNDPHSPIVSDPFATLIDPLIEEATEAFLAQLNQISIDHLCQRAMNDQALVVSLQTSDFTI
jgi:Rrf2 family protein